MLNRKYIDIVKNLKEVLISLYIYMSDISFNTIDDDFDIYNIDKYKIIEGYELTDNKIIVLFPFVGHFNDKNEISNVYHKGLAIPKSLQM